MSIESDVQQLSPGPIVELWEINATPIGGGVIRFQGQQDGTVWWQGLDYAPWPCAGDGFERTTDQQPTPILRVGNVNRSITLLCEQFEDLVGARITRRRTFEKYMDTRNFPPMRNMLRNSANAMGAGWSVENVSRSALAPVDVDGVTFQPVEVINTSTAANARNSQSIVFNLMEATVTLYMSFTASASMRFTIRNAASNRQFTLGARPDGFHSADGSGTMGAWQTLEYSNIAPDVWKWVIRMQPNELYGSMQFGVGSGVAAVGSSMVILGMQVEPGNTATPFQVTSSNLETDRNPTADPTKEFTPELWFIERKSGESFESVEFELSSALNFQGVNLPRRQIIANQCPFAYRGALCGYIGPPVADELDVPTSNPALDKCGKRLRSCEMRIWPDNILNYGGYPAAGLVRT